MIYDIEIGNGKEFGLEEFHAIVFEGKTVGFSQKTAECLTKTRRFIDHLLENNIKVYGLTTGFADLRNKAVSPQEAAQLSHNILQSHDAAIGPYLPLDVTLGAMVVRANSLANGSSGFTIEGLQTLVEMINARIVPCIPDSGSLGASGDLAFLSRLGRAMQGHDVDVIYKHQKISAKQALEKEGIRPFTPRAKEGLALTNGTSFMASMMGIAYLREIHELENMLAALILFLNAIEAIDSAFYENIQQVRGQVHQKTVAKIILDALKDSPFINRKEVQNDYSIRCLPQIYGPRFESIFDQYEKIKREISAVTDNPLIFRGSHICSDVHPGRFIPFEGENWVVLSGGNFHGEYITTIADTIVTNNAKIGLTMERHLTYLLNPFRNNSVLPHYLVPRKMKIGLNSGYMIPQYTANAIVQKMAQVGMPTSLFNITSANESEDIVSYGATAAMKLLNQIDLFSDLNTIYLTMAAQAYAIKREEIIEKGIAVEQTLSEKIFQVVNQTGRYPTYDDQSFEPIYKENRKLLNTSALRQALGFPLSAWGFGESKLDHPLFQSLVTSSGKHALAGQ